ncbi:nucleotide disphospho-sugar-binding domain-containing protein [Subtercola boreus]|uniref:Glycosyltransferase n=1 Tax=Subtercola boreus TaxID=120213 RepID=A0A3E0WFW3_9MICO|nr:glycosyltransferase [Subtercola boreus]RFA23417.1 glycosyltransferase [Subtercola boreus]RFA23810.1 glycosyltransferase [Subtercola boreus]RFA29511.1 glycosyltransferase [Subtercola boreus]
MTLLVISPDYASHLLPLATIATAWQEHGHEVVVATGPATAAIVQGFGFSRVNLQLGRGSNPGVIRAEDQPTGEDDALRGFFDATRRGMIETLRFQAEARSRDLLFDPVEKAREVLDVVERTKPDQIIVDHLAFGARLGLDAAGLRYGDVVLGHPSALPVGEEVYGHPPFWPTVFTPSAAELSGLRALNERIRDEFTAEWNAALATLNPALPPSRDAFAEHGDLLLFNYPEALHPPERSAALSPHVFLGASVRSEPVDDEVEAWIARSDRPIVYVSFGSFLSVRSDVLLRVSDALKQLDVRVALATGSSDPQEFAGVPTDWLVRAFLPQVTLLARASLIVSHGGNNSVTEAAEAGVPLLVLPFSTDQFAGAAGVVDAGVGLALAPNTASVSELREASIRLLTGPAQQTAKDLGAALRASPGRGLAYELLASPPRP